ncbi:MAG TPA: glycosyltransferase family 87 protein [Candidatus Dormibacteraeota bacterium]|nr:glycosyltransferase family 87 protein [Candidatus Dormibacteraeota bacterium]
MINRLTRAAADVFSRPALYWALAAAFWLRVAILTVLTPRRFDAEGMWEGAHAYLTEPSHIYDAAAQYIAQFHIIAPPGGLDAFVSPPPVAALATPVALLPKNIAVQVWTGIDAAAMLLALFLLYRLVATRHPLARPAFWLVAAYFPPLFSDVVAGQRGGILLLGAMASIALEANRPALAGAVGGLVAALKYYPAAMVIGARPEHRIRYAVVLFAVLVIVTVATFVPLGFGGAAFYFQHVLLPSLGSHNPDCAYDSVRTLFTRTIGGEQYAQPTATGYVLVTSPVHLPTVALALSYLSAIAFAAMATWAAWRSGWNPAYGMSLGFSLGALIPNEVWPYQWLPLLPLALLLVVRGIERRRFGSLAVLAILLLGFYRAPCDLIFPNIWTIAAIGIFILGVWENRLFRSGLSEGGAHGAER